MPDILSDELSQRCPRAFAVIEEASALARDFFEKRDALIVETKTGPQDVVSRADRAVEALIRDHLSEAFPDDGFLGEELGCTDGSTGWTWIIDPIDGTGSFLHGLDSWTVVIALARDGQTHAGFISHPMTRRLYHARAGQGAFLREEQSDRPITCDTAGRLDAGVIAVGAGGARHAQTVGHTITRIMETGGSYMRNGSAALSLAHVAAGHCLAFYEPELSAWDCLAGLLIVTEAGGTASPFALGPSRQPVLGAAPGIAPLLTALLSD